MSTPNYQRTTLVIRLGFWMALLFASYMAFAPQKTIPDFNVSFLFLHALTFTVLTFGLRLAYLPQAWLAAAAWMLLYGVLIEIVQGFTPDRAPELRDVLLDILGIALGTALFRWLGSFSERIARQLFG